MIITLLFASVPILSILILLIGLKWPAKRAMPISLVITACVAIFVWKVPLLHLAAATVDGIVVAFSIIWILLGAILLLNLLQVSGSFEVIKHTFLKLHPDSYVQLLIISWFFGAFMEGISGFGTPAAICAPLLIAIGFQPLAAVIFSLVANSIPVTFGAAGTTVLIGMRGGLESLTGINQDLDSYVLHIAEYTALINIFVGSLVPLIIVIMYARFFDKERSWKKGFSYWAIALCAGLSFTVSSWLVVRWIGLEFPTILSAPASLLVTILLFKKTYRKQASESASGSAELPSYSTPEVIKAWLPYATVILLLLISRLNALPFKSWLIDQTWVWRKILGSTLDTSLALLYSPGTFFLITIILVGFIFRKSLKDKSHILWKDTFSKVVSVGWILLTAVPLVRIFIFSDVNDAGYTSMPETLASFISQLSTALLPFASIMIGILGSFLSGSATFSNMMFAAMQYKMGIDTGISPDQLLGLQAVGANTGNMICIVNIVAACAVVGINDQEGTVMRNTMIPALIIAVLSAIVYVFLG